MSFVLYLRRERKISLFRHKFGLFYDVIHIFGSEWSDVDARLDTFVIHVRPNL